MRACVLVLMLSIAASAAEPPKVIAEGFKLAGTPCYGSDGLLYVTDGGEVDKENDGRIWVVNNGTSKLFVKELNHPRGLVYFRGQNSLYLAEKRGILKVDSKGNVAVVLPIDKFPGQPSWLTKMALDEQSQMLLVSAPEDSIIYRINLRTKAVEIAIDKQSLPGLLLPLAVTFDGASHFIFNDGQTGNLYRVSLHDRTYHKIAEKLLNSISLVWDHHGRLLIGLVNGYIYAIPHSGEEPILLSKTTTNISGACLEDNGRNLLYIGAKSINESKLFAIPTTIPGWEVDESRLPVELQLAFPDLQWTGWDDGSETGKVIPLRPLMLTHAGDGSNRNFVLIQQGTIHVFDNDDNAAKTKVFLDITKKVRYKDNQNEEGMLGLAFHPNYKKNGEFFVFYTDANAKLTNVISRFHVKKDDPNAADPDSEEVLLRIEKPYWNHDGGTLVFGPDGYLYIVHGDGGLGNDPHENGQNLKTHLGKILRIDVDKKENGKNYAIPPDNPFVKIPDAKPEIYAYGIRNIWRMAFDRQTGKLWAGDVGQNLFEEIDIIEKGGNYGWSLREGYHPFGKKGVDVRKDLIEPIWEYDHEIGKSITGGLVYRGKQIPELNGMYLYADYVATKVWALRYDEKKARVTENHAIKSPGVAVMSFGEDEKGEAYLMGASPKGRGIYRFVKKSQ
jgi:glucose/arabinose dehydrogenase